MTATRVLAVIALGLATLLIANPQSQPAGELKHLVVPLEGASHNIQLTAQSIDRIDGRYPSIVRLKGSVEIKSPVCIQPDPAQRIVCDGYMIVRADEAEVNEATGRIESHGNVTVIPIQHEK